jgi:putative hydrolase of the HAD superfamily
MPAVIRAALFDFGGVIVAGPWEAFADYEREHDLPVGLIRQINATDPDTNAWAQLERREVDLDGFAERFEAEAAALGHRVDGRQVLALLADPAGAARVRPEMVEAVRRCSERLVTGLLTNNFVSMEGEGMAGGRGEGKAGGRGEGMAGGRGEGKAGGRGEGMAGGAFASLLGVFDAVIESSQVGVRKPDPRFYELACATLDIQPDEAVFLDDLGVNLKPARALGMATIKVVDPADAIAELEAIVGFPLG